MALGCDPTWRSATSSLGVCVVNQEIYGDGKQTRDFTYVDDIVKANHRLLTDDSADRNNKYWLHK